MLLKEFPESIFFYWHIQKPFIVTAASFGHSHHDLVLNHDNHLSKHCPRVLLLCYELTKYVLGFFGTPHLPYTSSHNLHLHPVLACGVATNNHTTTTTPRTNKVLMWNHPNDVASTHALLSLYLTTSQLYIHIIMDTIIIA